LVTVSIEHLFYIFFVRFHEKLRKITYLWALSGVN